MLCILLNEMEIKILSYDSDNNSFLLLNDLFGSITDRENKIMPGSRKNYKRC